MKQIQNEQSERACPGVTIDGRRFVISNKKEIFYEVMTLVVLLVITVALLYGMVVPSLPSIFVFNPSWYIGIGVATIVFFAATLYLGISQRTVSVKFDKNSGLMTVTRIRYVLLSKTIMTAPLNEIVRIRQAIDYLLRTEYEPIFSLDVKVYAETRDGKKIFLFRDSQKFGRSACASQFLGVPIEKDPVPAWRRFI